MGARTPEEYARLLRWLHVPAAVLFIALALFVHKRFPASRRSLLVAACLTRVAALVANFTTGENINFAHIDALKLMDFGGFMAAVPVGSVNPWMILGQANILLLLVFLVDAILRTRRQDSRRQYRAALRICGSAVLFLLLSNAWHAGVVLGVVHAPDIFLPNFMCVIFIMSLELGGEVLRADKLFTALQVTADRLRQSERRMEVAIRAAQIGLWSWDAGREQLWLSEFGRRLLGFDPQETVSRAAFAARVHTEDVEQVRRSYEQALDLQGDFRCEFRYALDEGAWRWISLRGQAYAATRGEPGRVHGVLLDFTERRQREAESAMQRDELAHLSRVALLAELSGSLAHELNQPLTAILSNAQAGMRFLASEPPNLEEIRESFVNIVESDKRGGEVIRRLRAMLRKEATDFRMLSLNDVVADVLRIIRSDLLNRNTQLVLDLEPGLPDVPGDSIQLQQVLMNLVMNGCDAMMSLERGRELTLRTRSAADGSVEVTASDIGRGIAPEDLERIFQPFVTTKSDGMGLGLAVCRTIIESHSGRLWASNNAGGGASLHFHLPGPQSAA
jgi:PAS domain S-box-containing protein